MITELINLDNIILDLRSETKEEVLKEFIDKGSELGLIENKDFFLKRIIELENLGSSALEKGIALPHIRDDCVNKLFLLFGVSRKGVDFDSIDGYPSNIIIFIGAKRNEKLYLPLISRISRMLSFEEIRKKILNSRNTEDIKMIIKNWETN